ncbi:MAG TPA: prolipoprotein diacylglyceryl transferase [Firmicutes bacterium]|jgi:hypothetical protein|nr:prolipoprotein diacylglyceryl transferase [Bacillota bacterium]
MEGEFCRIGPFTLYSYGCGLAAAFLVGTTLVLREARYREYDKQRIWELVIGVICVGLVAGRIGYCLPDLWYYLTHPWEILRVPQGGISYIPALLAGVFYVFRFARKYGEHPFIILDMLAPGLAAGLIIGFLGAVEVMPYQGALQIGSTYWAPPVLAFFVIDYVGLWYLSTSRRRLIPGRRFMQIIALDAAGRTLSSVWAWALYGSAVPHAFSAAFSFALLVSACWVYRRLLPRVAEVTSEDASTAVTGAGFDYLLHTRKPRRKRLPVRHRLLLSGFWFMVLLVCIFILGQPVIV